MAHAVYGQVSPASGALVTPVRVSTKSIEIVVERINLEEHTGDKCPVCSNLKDILTVHLNHQATFFNCPCGHNWTKDCSCIEEN